MISFESILFNSLIYFSTAFKSEVTATLLVVIITPLLSEQMKLVDTSNFIPFRSLLIFNI